MTVFTFLFSFAPSLPAASSLVRMTLGSVAMEKPLQSETNEGEENLIGYSPVEAEEIDGLALRV
jgi:hypothetical protein